MTRLIVDTVWRSSEPDGVIMYLTTVGNSSMLYRVEMKMAARMQSFPIRARLITSTGSPAHAKDVSQ